MREAKLQRSTTETRISLVLNIDQGGIVDIDTSSGFFDHMLEQLAFHAQWSLQIKALGDVETGYHHTVEDVGIVLGQALKQVWADHKGLVRYGDVTLPMDDALVQVACDISGRPYLGLAFSPPGSSVGGFSVELVEEFFRAMTTHSGLTLHIRQLAGRNTHHIIEAIFKGCGRALSHASQCKGDIVLSTKGAIGC